MNLLDAFVIRHELTVHRRWLNNIYADWHKQKTREDKDDLARRLVARLTAIAELEERRRS
jgi:hypothetical protein